MEAVSPTLSLRERDRRWELVRGLMKSRGVDPLIIFGLKGRAQFDCYVTNDYAQGIVVFPLEGQPTYLTWCSMFIIRHMESSSRGETPWIEDWRVGTTGAKLVAVMQEKGFDSATIGVVGRDIYGPAEPEGYISYKTWSHIAENLPNATFVDVSLPFAELFLVKSEEELALLRHSARIGEMACEAMLKITKPGVSENEVFATIMQTIYANGANAPMLNLHTGVDNASWGPPIWLNQAQRPYLVQKGDMVQSEIFVSYGSMETQQPMTIAVKPVHPVNQECAEVARRSYEAGLNVLRPGKAFREVAEAMEAVVAEAGCWLLNPLIHSLNPLYVVGQVEVGVEQLPGIEKYELIKAAPVRAGDLIVKPGMVFSLEPNACRGKHRANLGSTVLVTEDGVEELNKLPTEVRLVD